MRLFEMKVLFTVRESPSGIILMLTIHNVSHLEADIGPLNYDKDCAVWT
jgi:hypothetical protein